MRDPFITPASPLVKRNCIFQMGHPSHARSAMVRDTYLGHDGVSPGKTLCIRNQSLKNPSTSQNYPLCCIPRCSVIILTKARDLTTIANIYFIDRFAIETVDRLCRSCPSSSVPGEGVQLDRVLAGHQIFLKEKQRCSQYVRQASSQYCLTS